MRNPAVASMIIIGAGLMMMMALIGVVIGFTGVIEDTYAELALKTPQFDYRIEDGGEHGNEIFDAYVLLRYVGVGLLVLVLVIAGLSKVFEASELGIMQPGTANRLISKSLLFLLIFFIFPPMWDMAVDVTENIALWILNPSYSFKEDNPCPESWSQADIDLAFAESPYITPSAKNTGGVGLRDGTSFVCWWDVKMKFVFGQMLRQTELTGVKQDFDIIDDSASSYDPICGTTLLEDNLGNTESYDQNTEGWLTIIQGDLLQGAETIFTNLFLGLTKALVSIQVLIVALLIGIMADMLTAMVIAALPLFLMLSLIPKADDLANKMIQAIPALILLPIMSSIIIVVGAAAILNAGDLCPEGLDVGQTAWDTIYTWITAVGVVFFAVTLPTLMIPMLGSVSQMGQSIVSSAVSTGAMVTGMTATSAAQGAINARRGGAGIAGTAMGLFGGAGKGLFASHGSVSMPGFQGQAVGDPGPLTQGIGNAQNTVGHGLPSGGEQNRIVSQGIENVSNSGGNVETTDLLNDAGMSGHHWDSNLSDAANRKIIDQDIQNYTTANDGLSSDEKALVQKYQGDFRTTAKMENINSNHISHLSEKLDGQPNMDKVSYKVERENILSNLASERYPEEFGNNKKSAIAQLEKEIAAGDQKNV